MEKVAPNGTGLVASTIGATLTLPAALIATLPTLGVGDYIVCTLTSELTPVGGVGSIIAIDTINVAANSVNIIANLADTVALKTTNTNLALVGVSPVNVVFDALATALITRPTQRTVNNASFVTDTQLLQTSTSLVVPLAARSLFTSTDLLGLPDAMYRLTLDDLTNDEIVLVVGYDPTTGTMDIARGAEGTLANIFAAGSKAEIRLTAGLLEQKTLPTPETIYATATEVIIREIDKTIMSIAGGGVKLGDVSSVNALLNGIAIGTGALSSTDNIAIGHGSSTPSAGKTVAIGTSAVASAIRTVVIGEGTNATLERDVSIGYTATCTDARSVAIGAYAKCLAYKCVSVGDFAETNASWSIAIGQNCYTTIGATDSVTVGQFSDVQAAESVALGGSASVNNALAVRSIALGFGTHTTKPRTLSTGHSRHMLYYLNTDNSSAASAIEVNGTSLIAGSTLYVGSGIGMGILPDDVTVHITNVTGVASVPPVFTLETQAVSSTVTDNEVVASLVAPVVIGTLGANIVADNNFDKLTAGFPANKPITGVRLTLTTPPVGITAWRVHLLVRGVLLSTV